MTAARFPRRRQAHDPGGAGAPPLVLDAAAMARLRQLDPDGSRGFLEQVLRTYEMSLARHLATLEEARATRDARRAGDVAHTLKSSSASIGALRFSEACAGLEAQVRAGDAGALDAPLEALLAEGRRVQAAVRAMLPP